MTVPTFDDRLRRDLEALGQEGGSADAFERVTERKKQLPRKRRVQALTLAIVLVTASTGAGYALFRAFKTTEPSAEKPMPVPSSQYTNGRIAFVEFEGEDWDIFTSEPDGSDVRQVTKFPGADSQPAWSEDGTRIAYVRHNLPSSTQGNVWVMNADGSDPVRVAVAYGNPAPTWSPDGTEIAYTRGNGRLFRVGVGGQDEPELLIDGGVGGFPDWSPDGGRIAFGRSSGGLAILDLETHQIDQVTLGQDFGPSWSPDGRYLAFIRRICGLCSLEVFIVRADGTNLRRITQDDYHEQFLTWSPDGKQLLFERALEGFQASFQGLWTAAVDGSGERQLQTSASAGFSPVWQPVPPRGGATLPPPPAFEGGTCILSAANGDFDGDGRSDVAVTRSESEPPCRPPDDSIEEGASLEVDLGNGRRISTECGRCLALAAPDLNDDGHDELMIEFVAPETLRGPVTTTRVGFYVLEHSELHLVERSPGVENYREGPAVFPLALGMPKPPNFMREVAGLMCGISEQGRELHAIRARGSTRGSSFTQDTAVYVLEGSILHWRETRSDTFASIQTGGPFPTASASVLALCA